MLVAFHTVVEILRYSWARWANFRDKQRKRDVFSSSYEGQTPVVCQMRVFSNEHAFIFKCLFFLVAFASDIHLTQNKSLLAVIFPIVDL